MSQVVQPPPDSPSSPVEVHPGPGYRRRRRWRRVALAAMILLLLGIAGGELFARFYLGLGDPPLLKADPEIEYLPLPGKTYRRFGNTISYNSHSMRSPEFPPRKQDPFELRILVIGDSVVNGGALTDQAELATTRLAGSLTTEFKRPVVVGNIAAGSWGPPNQLAYLERFGLFDADAVVFVLNSEDAHDVPTFEGLPLPTRRPVLALQEAVMAYAPLAFRYHVLGELQESDRTAAPAPADLAAGVEALDKMLRLVRDSGAKVLLIHHPRVTELQSGRYEPGFQEIRAAAARAGVRFIEMRPEMLRLLQEEQRGYRDWIHPDAAGQHVLGTTIARELTALLRGNAPPAPR